MSAEYSVARIRKAAKETFTIEQERMLTAYAERIEADERAVPVGYVNERDLTFLHASGHPAGPRECRIASEPFGNMKAPLFTRPPAQAAQVDASDAELMAEWFKADGSVHGPNVETVTMPQAKYLAFRRSITHPHSPDAADSGRITDEVVDAALFSETTDEYGDPTAMLIDFMGMGSTEKLGLARRSVRAAITAALAAQGQGDAVAWRIDTDDDVERVAKAAGWDNRRYMTPADYAIWCSRMREFVRLAAEHPASPAGVPDAKAMAYRFMGWRLPDDFRPDCGISFDPESLKSWPGMWPTGTNLFHVGQAEQMFRYVLAAAPSATPEGGEGGL